MQRTPFIIKRRTKARDASPLDPWKWIALAITIIGVLAWTGGTAYYEGYWSAVGWSKPIISQTVQETAYAGFTGPLYNWFIGGLLFVACGIYIAFIEFLGSLPQPTFQIFRRRRRSRPSRLSLWLARRKQFSKSTTRFVVVMIASGVALSLLMTLPLIIWCVAASSQGKSHFEKAICQARETKTFRSKIVLADGTIKSGRILDRSDKITVLLDAENIHIIAAGEKSVILDSTNVGHVACPSVPKS
nr:hypothetical protein [uncultured Duganella sp.]